LTAAVDLAISRFGKFDILVNNTGVFIGKGIEEISLEEWNRLVAVNMTSWPLRHCAKRQRQRPWQCYCQLRLDRRHRRLAA
jgi:NAD(P)-dependent dehydrogenase (short-subunit alcohol dehydrogenase family)